MEVLMFLSAVRDVPPIHSNALDLFWKILSTGNFKKYWLNHISSFSSEDFSEYAGSRTCRKRTITRELESATQRGELTVIQSELRVAACHIDAVNRLRNTALHKASESGHMEVVNFLVSQGASLNARNSFGNTAHVGVVIKM